MSNTNPLIARISQMNINQIKEIAAYMFNDTTSEGGLIFEATLNVLEEKMEESDFVRFCEKLAA